MCILSNLFAENLHIFVRILYFSKVLARVSLTAAPSSLYGFCDSDQTMKGWQGREKVFYSMNKFYNCNFWVGGLHMDDS